MLYIASRTLTTQLVRLLLELNMITVRGRGRSRRPSEGSRRSRVWISPTPTSALKARGSRTFPELELHSAAPRSARKTINTDMETLAKTVTASTSSFASSPRGSPPQHEASSSRTTISSSLPLLPPAPPCWPSATSLWTSGARGFRLSVALGGGREMAAADLLPHAEAVLRQELKGLADAAERSRKSQSSSSSGSPL
jgi:hypothetical protein